MSIRRVARNLLADYTPPKNYTRGLNPQTRKKRVKELKRRDKSPKEKYDPLPGDESAKTKPSQYSKTELAEKVRQEMSGNSKDAFLKAVSKITGISKSILSEVHERGARAWETGHRPGASQVAWARARVYSFATGGKTQKTTDKDLWEKSK